MAERSYFEWLCGLVDNGRPYKSLLKLLYKTKFYFIMELDENRAFDGLDLRDRYYDIQRFSLRNEEKKALSKKPCSVLEVMAALAIRCEEHIMSNPLMGDRTAKWFWEMVESLGLTEFNDGNFDRNEAEEIIDCFLQRKYGEDGRGGLFTLRTNDDVNMRKTEIWYQMMRYLDEI